MKTSLEQVNVERIGDVGRTGQFSIRATGKAFRILSDGLYTNKPLAIVRELSCNAADAHVAAGKDNEPFEIKLPTQFDPMFYVKDYGTGLSEEDIYSLYTTYFDSDKTDSNKFIGALGLGSKSPFSYTDSFVVESRFNGVLSTYTMYIAEGSVPNVSKMNEAPTLEPNGLTVSFSVKPEDIQRFVDETQKVMARFNPMPRIVGRSDIEPKTIEYVLKSKEFDDPNACGWALRHIDRPRAHYGWRARDNKSNDGYDTNGLVALQGNVPYPIHNTDFPDLSSVTDLPLEIQFPIGELEVAASREELSYDKRTIANIRAKLEQVRDEIRKEASKKLVRCKTLWDASRKYLELCDSSIGHMIKGNSTWTDKNGVTHDLKGTVDFVLRRNVSSSVARAEIRQVASLRIMDRTILKYNVKPRSDEIPILIDKDVHGNNKLYWALHTSQTMLFVQTKPCKGPIARVIKYMRDTFSDNYPSAYILRLAYDKNGELLPEAKKYHNQLLKLVGEHNIKYIENLNALPAKALHNGMLAHVRKFREMGWYSIRDVVKLPDDPAETAYYVDLYGTSWDIRYNGKNIAISLQDLNKVIYAAGMSKANIFGLFKSGKDRIINNSKAKWVNLFDHIRDNADSIKLTTKSAQGINWKQLYRLLTILDITFYQVLHNSGINLPNPKARAALKVIARAVKGNGGVSCYVYHYTRDRDPPLDAKVGDMEIVSLDDLSKLRKIFQALQDRVGGFDNVNKNLSVPTLPITRAMSICEEGIKWLAKKFPLVGRVATYGLISRTETEFHRELQDYIRAMLNQMKQEESSNDQ